MGEGTGSSSLPLTNPRQYQVFSRSHLAVDDVDDCSMHVSIFLDISMEGP
jgi:hypothetical protein